MNIKGVARPFRMGRVQELETHEGRYISYKWGKGFGAPEIAWGSQLVRMKEGLRAPSSDAGQCMHLISCIRTTGLLASEPRGGPNPPPLIWVRE